MRVIMDATAIPRDLGGVGRYVVEVARALSAEGVDLVLAARADAADDLATRCPDAEIVAAPPSVGRRPARLAWEQVGLPRLVRATRSDVLHSPHYTMPLGRVPAARVVTLHDATFFSDPQVHSRVKRVTFRAAIRTAVRRADALVVPSRATRDEVLRFAGGDSGRFHVAFHGVDAEMFHRASADEQDRVARSLGVEAGAYVAFLGTLEPRKNVPALVRGWVRTATGRERPPELVLAGGKGWDRTVDQVVADVPSQLRVLRPGYLPQDDLAGYLSGAAVVAYPSLGEGFGLPVLEAMACGAVVLTTRELSLPEVGGDAVAYCGTSADSIAEGLAALLDDPARRSELARAAVARAAQFTWAASAREHVSAFEAALRRRR